LKRFYLSGHRTFGNRGCEAIVRGTVTAMQSVFGAIEVLVPSYDIRRDSDQWPEAKEHGVEFVAAYTPWYTRYWAHTQRLPLAALKRAGWPFPFPTWLKEHIASVDAVFSVGGDNYSLDYRLPSLLMGMDGLAKELGKPVVLWGASVGPFDREPHFLPAIRRHLAGMNKILVRESVSHRYLTEKMGLENVEQMVDPGFILRSEPIESTTFWPAHAEQGVIGLNVSPLVERYKKPGQSLLKEIEGFIRAVIERGFSVLLVPHVVPLDGTGKNDDARYMHDLLKSCGDLGNCLSMTPHDFNAAQIKYIISRLRFFIGARTHATIAALSSGVPTISIAYSIKARGINRDLFGNEWMVLPTPELSTRSLLTALDNLVEHESDLKETLYSAMAEYEQKLKTTLKQLEL
jgi:colanic acid/amylovoran biosynthesis protein